MKLLSAAMLSSLLFAAGAQAIIEGLHWLCLSDRGLDVYPRHERPMSWRASLFVRLRDMFQPDLHSGNHLDDHIPGIGNGVHHP